MPPGTSNEVRRQETDLDGAVGTKMEALLISDLFSAAPRRNGSKCPENTSGDRPVFVFFLVHSGKMDH